MYNFIPRLLYMSLESWMYTIATKLVLAVLSIVTRSFIVSNATNVTKLYTQSDLTTKTVNQVQTV